MRTQSSISAAVLVMAVFVTLAECNGRCPEESSEFGGNCFMFHALKHDREVLKAKSGIAYAEKICADLTLGHLKWWLPKIDSVAENEFIGDFFRRQKDKKGGSSIWLCLRRYEKSGTNDSIEWADHHKWYWASDNDSLTDLVNQNIDLWDQNQPAVGEQCAVLTIEAKFQWRSARCQYIDYYNERAPDIGGIVCEAKLAKEIPIHEQPWFFPVCGSLVGLSILALLAALIWYWFKKKPRRKHQKKQSDSSGSIIHRKASPRKTLLPKRKKRSSWYGYSAPPTDSSTPDASKDPTKDDDDTVTYSNLQVIKDDASPSGSKSVVKKSVTATSNSMIVAKNSPGGKVHPNTSLGPCPIRK